MKYEYLTKQCYFEDDILNVVIEEPKKNKTLQELGSEGWLLVQVIVLPNQPSAYAICFRPAPNQIG